MCTMLQMLPASRLGPRKSCGSTWTSSIFAVDHRLSLVLMMLIAHLWHSSRDQWASYCSREASALKRVEQCGTNEQSHDALNEKQGVSPAGADGTLIATEGRADVDPSVMEVRNSTITISAE